MSQVTAAMVNELRQRTGLPMMDCKNALVEAGGEMAKAEENIRKKGFKIKADRTTGEGRIAIYIDPVKKVGAMVELLCESAPVAKSDLFVALGNDAAKQVALEKATTPEQLLAQKFVDNPSKTINDRFNEVMGMIREVMKPNRMIRLEGQLGSYVHHDGSIGVLLQVEGANPDPQLLRDVCMHITASRPVAANRDEVPAAVVAKEMEIAKAQIAQDPKNAGKPAQIIEKIAEGKLKTFFAESVLVEQPFVKDSSKTVGQLLEAAKVKVIRFVRYKVGEVAAATPTA
jgi:elongation factor Ts